MELLYRGYATVVVSFKDCQGHSAVHKMTFDAGQDNTLGHLQAFADAYAELCENLGLGSVDSVAVNIPYYNGDFEAAPVNSQVEDKTVGIFGTSARNYSSFAVPAPDQTKLLDLASGLKGVEFDPDDADVAAWTAAVLNGIEVVPGTTLRPIRIDGDYFTTTERVYHQQRQSQASNRRAG